MMFGFFNKRKYGSVTVNNRAVDVALIVRDGKIIYTSEMVKGFDKNRLEGQIFEVSLETRSGNPYFIYYLCHEYYMATVGRGGVASLDEATTGEEFRAAVSQKLAEFLVLHMSTEFRTDIRRDISSYSHNRAHTNVLAYVKSLGEWYAIQHNDFESDDAAERKVAHVNAGEIQIEDVIAVDFPSPNAA